MVGGDEGIYYNAARLYAATGEAFANHCIAENVSSIGSYNWYGPFWSVFYGLGYKLFGSGIGILIFNLSSSLLAILAIIKLIPKNNYLLAIALMSSYPFLYYQFSFYPEAPILLCSILNLALLIRIVQYQRLNLIPLFFLIILLEVPLRITSVFWLFGLIPILSKKNFWYYGGLIVSGVLIGFLYMKFFCAPAFERGLANLDQAGEKSILNFITDTLRILGSNTLTIFREHNLTVLTFYLLLIVTSVLAILKRNYLLFSIAAVSVISTLIFMSFYSTLSFFFIKQTIFIWPLMIYGINMYLETKKIQIFTFFVLMCSFVPSVFYSKKNIEAHRTPLLSITDQKFKESMTIIKSFKSNDEVVTILFHAPDLENYRRFHLYLPIINSEGVPIRYTTNVCFPSCNESEKFKQHNKLTIDYTVVPKRSSFVPIESTRVIETELFNFYTKTKT